MNTPNLTEIEKTLNDRLKSYYKQIQDQSQLLQETRTNQNWEPLLMYMLEAIEQTSIQTSAIVI